MTALPVNPHAPASPLRHALAHAAHLLPAQNPIDRFVHHNTLHAFEDRPFEEAVVEAARTFGAEPFLSLAEYREAYRVGRIHGDDIEVEVARAVSAGPVAGILDRRRLVVARMLHPIEPLRGEALAWHLSETDALRQIRADLEPEAHHALLAESGYDEARALTRLWDVASSRRAELELHLPAPAPRVRLRDELVARGWPDPDGIVHAVLVRWSAAFLDHGMAYWPMQGREEGFLVAFAKHFQVAVPGQPWTRRLAALLAAVDLTDPEAVAAAMLQRIGHEDESLDEVVLHTLLALRGWAGMFQRLAERPDTAPGAAPLTPRLEDFLAVRLLLDVAVAQWLLGDAAPGMLARARQRPLRLPEPPDPVWELFQLCQLLGISAHRLAQLSPAALHDLLEEVVGTDEVALRRLWHRAYERRHRVELLDAVVIHSRRVRADVEPAPVRVQAVFCIDDREESLRRHLEERAPWFRTYGYAGNYGISMYFRSATSGRPEPLGPAGAPPRHLVEEVAPPAVPRWQGLLAHHSSVASHTLFRGALVTLGGLGAAVPLLWRVLHPRSHARAFREERAFGPLRYRRDGDARDPDTGCWLGFDLGERVAIVAAGLRTIGLVDGFAPLVFVFGHGSVSVNNPHEAGYNCGACGGGRGGPNARLFAAMANEPEVREALREQGIDVPETTWFVAGYHNTSEDGIELYDLDQVPVARRADLAEATDALDRTRAWDAHERCRKFVSAPLDLTPEEALAHVEGRAADLAQARPEYNHATNAVALVGRRDWSRGLFLDRRSFLISYDPATDPDLHVLTALLANVVPVGSGINLEYFFSTVDNRVYGCGSKLPHNVTSLVGVMDGHASDLRTGLNAQMVEIHEPVRLLCVVEASPHALLEVARRAPAVGRLVVNEWVQLASLDPTTGALQLFRDGAFHPWVVQSERLVRVERSVDWYRGTRGLLPPATIGGAP